jgi:hypothetical protein
VNQIKSKLVVICIALIYCFAAALSTDALFHASFKYSLKTSEERHFSDITKSLYTQPSSAQSLISHAPSGPVQGLKKPGELSLAFSENREKLIESGFSQYSKNSENQLIHYRKSDLIFPFHYFW